MACRRRLLAAGLAGALLSAPLLAGAAVPPPAPLAPFPGTTARISVSSAGREGHGGSVRPAVSPDGRWVVFSSTAADLTGARSCYSAYAPGLQIYLRDRKTGRTELISELPGRCVHPNTQQPEDADGLSVSADGRCVAFIAGPQVPGFDADGSQIYVRDRKLRRTIPVTVAPDGKSYDGESEGPILSADCHYIAFSSTALNAVPGTAKDATGVSDAYVRDLRTGHTERVGPNVHGRGNSWDKRATAMTPDARYVTFVSNAPPLWSIYGFGDIVPSTYLSGLSELYVYDRRTKRTEIVSLAEDQHMVDYAIAPLDAAANVISADGRYVVFATPATNVVRGDDSVWGSAPFTVDNGSMDVYLRDRETQRTIRVTTGPSGVPGDANSAQPTISADGRWIAFSTAANNLGDLDLTPSLRTGNYPRYNSYDDPYLAGYDIVLYDRLTGTHRIVSRATGGTQGNDLAMDPVLNADGTVVVYTSRATNLVPDDTNGQPDVFVYQRPADPAL